jgi:hypothetical protein
MSSPVDDPTDDAADDPALSYPRGNRLGLRHPRPTVVIVVAVVVVLAGACAWQALQPATARFCNLTGTAGPVRGDARGAFEAWWDDGGARSAAATASQAVGEPVPEPSLEDFERSGEEWTWVFAEGRSVLVSVRDNRSAGTDGYLVGGVNACTFGTAAELGV